MKKLHKWKIEALKSSLDAGWKERENGNMETAQTYLNATVHLGLQLLDTDLQKNDKKEVLWIVIESLNHLGILYKILYRKNRNKYYAFISRNYFYNAYLLFGDDITDINKIATQYFHLGEANLMSNDTDEAIKYFKKAQDSSKDIEGKIHSKIHLAQAYGIKSKTDKTYLNKALNEIDTALSEFDSKIKDVNESTIILYSAILLTKATILSIKDIDKALDIANKSLELTKKFNSTHREKQSEKLIEVLKNSPETAIDLI